MDAMQVLRTVDIIVDDDVMRVAHFGVDPGASATNGEASRTAHPTFDRRAPTAPARNQIGGERRPCTDSSSAVIDPCSSTPDERMPPVPSVDVR